MTIRYTIEFSPEALDDLRWFKRPEQTAILASIEANLGYEPTLETRNRKRLRPNDMAEWELRVDQYRVFYNVAAVVRIVSIAAIGVKLGNRLRFRGEKGDL